MQKHSNPYGFLANSMGAPHGDKDGCIAPAFNNSSNYFLMSSNSWGLWPYMDFHMGLASSSRGILCMSPSFLLGGARVGSVPWNTSQSLYNTVCNKALLFSYIFIKCGNAPFGRSLSPYKISLKKNTGLPDVFIYFSYIIWKPLVVPPGNSYCTSIIWVSRFF